MSKFPPDKLVIFSSTGAHIELDPGRILKYTGRPNTILNPDLSKVKHLPAQYWMLHEGQVVPRHAAPHTISLTNKVRRTMLSKVNWVQVLSGTVLGAIAASLAHHGGWL